MRAPILRLFPWLFCLAVALGAAEAPEVEVASVKFANLRAPNGASGTWLEADIALLVHPGPGAPGAMVPRVRVTLTLGFELPGMSGGERRLEYYRAEAECVALEAGRADVRFYLPPEIVKRDQLRGDPKYWGVDLSASGRRLLAGRPAYSTTIVSAEQRKNFAALAAAAEASNEGLLQPQYLTLFAGEYPRTTPSFVRREPR